MTVGQLYAFLAVAAVVIVTPGPDTALTIRNTLAGGRSAGILTAAGVACGQLAWSLAAALGVAAILAASEPVFAALKLVGAAYLVFLGAQSIVWAVRGVHAESAGARASAGRRARPLRQGLLSNLANPKMAIFFTSLLPQFAGAQSSLVTVLGLGVVFCTMTLAWLSLYALAVTRVRPLVERRGVRRVLDAVSGAALVALGLRLATERR